MHRFMLLPTPFPGETAFVIFCGFMLWNLLTDKKMAWDWKIIRDKTVGDTRYTSVDEQKQLPMFVYVFSVPQVPHQTIQRIWLKCHDSGFFVGEKSTHTDTDCISVVSLHYIYMHSYIHLNWDKRSQLPHERSHSRRQMQTFEVDRMV